VDNLFSLQGKHIVITGASSGIGQECAKVCSEQGASLTLLGRNEEKLKETVSGLSGSNHLSFALKNTEIDETEKSIQEAVQKTGRVDGFIHSAGISEFMAFRMSTNVLFMDNFAVNALYGFEIAKILSKKKIVSKLGASFVFISSIASNCGVRGQVAYAASKGALHSGAKSLALELAPSRIRVNTISPGMVKDTPMTKELLKAMPSSWIEKNEDSYPLGMLSSEDIAYGCIFLLCDSAAKITGTDLVIDGGFSAQ
jgi:NAD(P)-dependent dehydrogenase (short-subunit alcohol dehydrogenase family)